MHTQKQFEAANLYANLLEEIKLRIAAIDAQQVASSTFRCRIRSGSSTPRSTQAAFQAKRKEVS